MRRMIVYFQQIFKVSFPEKEVLQELYVQISSSLTKAYMNPDTEKFIRTLTVSSLLGKSVELFVGSRSTPRNVEILHFILDQAQRKARQQGEFAVQQQVRYYSTYFMRMDAMKKGDEKQYEWSSDLFMELAAQGDPLSNYLMGKQSYKLIETSQEGDLNMEDLFLNSSSAFQSSLCWKQFGGLFYIAQIHQKATSTHNSEISQQEIEDLYIRSASFGYPLAYFKLSQIYKAQSRFQLYKKYLILAAQGGVVEAKHNLGIQYLQGQHLPKDQMKAFAWFLNASALGFAYSKYNASQILLKGSACGRILPNKKAALVYLEEINASGELDVEEQVKRLVEQINMEG